MKGFRRIVQNTTWDWIYFLPLALIAFSLPFGIRTLSITIVFFFLLTLIGLSIKKLKVNLPNPRGLIYWILFITFYLLLVIWLLFIEDKESAKITLRIRLSMLVLPTFILLVKGRSRININMVLHFFVVGAFMAASGCYISALIHTIRIGPGLAFLNGWPSGELWANYFIGSSFSWFIHPSYLTMYISMAIAILLKSLIFGKSGLIIPKPAHIFLIIFFSFTVFLLSSRAGIITWISIISYTLLLLFIKNKSSYKSIFYLIFLVLLGILAGLVFQKGKKFSLIADQLRNTSAYEDQELGSVALRIVVWKEAVELIKKEPVLGYGTGNVKNTLYSQVSNPLLNQPKEMNLNVHNQFLETWLEQGIIGLLLLLTIIFYPIFSKKIYNKQLLIYLSIIIFINFFFESMLNRINGVAFFAFFYSLLALGPIESNKEKE